LKIILIFAAVVLITSTSYAEDRWDTIDKKRHLYLSGHISLMVEVGQLAEYDNGKGERDISSFEVFSIVTAIACSKEYLIDRKPSRKDMYANALGSALGILTANFLTYRW